MTIKLMALPYSADALEPAVSARTIKLHHGKHHKSYVDKTNELTENTALFGKPLEDIIAAARADKNTPLFNQAAQVWNHGFYWESLSPRKTKPSAALDKAIAATFGSQTELLAKLNEKAAAQFGSGWAWLVRKGAKLEIETTSDAQQPAGAKTVPLLVIDVWEHAYYLDHKNKRDAYLKAAAKILNWKFASDNFASDTPWTYPG